MHPPYSQHEGAFAVDPKGNEQQRDSCPAFVKASDLAPSIGLELIKKTNPMLRFEFKMMRIQSQREVFVQYISVV